jgi:hypothetical protein
MNMKILAIMAAAIVVVAGLVFLIPSGEGNENMNATAVIYIQNADSGEVLMAEMDLDGPSMSEQMMLSFGSEIRKTDFKPLDFTGNIAAVSFVGNYQIWVVCKAKVSATDDIASLTKLTCDWYGKPGAKSDGSTTAPDHATTSAPEKLKTVGGAFSVQMEKTGLAFGTEYTFDQSAVSNGKFSNYYNTDTKIGSNLIGARVEGATRDCSINALAIEDSGASIGTQVSATLKIIVGSWSQTGLSVVITGMSAGSAAA